MKEIDSCFFAEICFFLSPVQMWPHHAIARKDDDRSFPFFVPGDAAEIDNISCCLCIVRFCPWRGVVGQKLDPRL